MKNNENIKIEGYTTYQTNSTEELHDGCAILIKSHIKHRLDNNYITDFLDVKIETNIGHKYCYHIPPPTSTLHSIP